MVELQENSPSSLTVSPRSCGDCAGFGDTLRELEQSLFLAGERQQGGNVL